MNLYRRIFKQKHSFIPVIATALFLLFSTQSVSANQNITGSPSNTGLNDVILSSGNSGASIASEGYGMLGRLNFIPVMLQAADGTPLSVTKDSVVSTLLVILVVLVLIIVLLAFISVNVASMIRVREGKEGYTFGVIIKETITLLKNRYIAIAGNFVMLLVTVTFLVNIARGVGLHQNYGPEQPVKFSHKLHAGEQDGQLAIDCQYCHTGASKGKNAWIPSVNVCMNCHSVVAEGPKYGTEEIAKVKAAYDNGEPIEWIRIHNLPDHAYFNHKQHVVVGDLECQTCHGPIEEMEKVYQYSPLSMGWCVNCHRETELNHDLYEEMGIETRGSYNEAPSTVASMGGINCARCHY